MAKRIPLSLCLLTSIIFAGVPTQAAMTVTPMASQTQSLAQQDAAQANTEDAVEETAPAEEATPELATLTLEDLPSGFTELPPELATQVASRLAALQQQLGQTGMKPDSYFAFVNPQNFQIVFGFTSKIPDQSAQANFDASLQQLQQSEAQEQVLSQLRERLEKVGGIKVLDYNAIPGLNTLANASTGITMALEMQGQPLRMDFAAFRRDTVGAFTAVMYANGEQPAVGVDDVARRLDDRIVELSADANRSSFARVR